MRGFLILFVSMMAFSADETTLPSKTQRFVPSRVDSVTTVVGSFNIRVVIDSRTDSEVVQYARTELQSYFDLLFSVPAEASSRVIHLSSAQPNPRVTPGFESTDSYSLIPSDDGLIIQGSNDRS